MKRLARQPMVRLVVGLLLLGFLAGIIPGRGEAGRGEGKDPAASGERAPFAAALGGYRSLAADLSWLRVYEAWIAREPGAVRERIRQTVSLGPDESFFWQEGARMLAYDLPVWRAARTSGPVTAAERERWQREAALEGLALLAEGRTHRPHDPALLAELGRLYWLRLKEPGKAVEFLAEAERLAGGDSRYRRWRILAEAEKRARPTGRVAGEGRGQ